MRVRFADAMGAWTAGDADRALALCDAVRPHDAGSADRLALLRGRVLLRMHRNRDAIALLEERFGVNDRGDRPPAALEANMIMALGNYAVERLDLERWSAIERRAERVPWEAAGLSYYRFWFEIDRSMAGELLGTPHTALHAARNAAACAPSAAFRLFAQCRRAAVLFAYGELLGYGDLVASIRQEFDAIDIVALSRFEEITVPVAVAETLALLGDGPGAREVLARTNAMSAQQIALLTDEPAKRAYLALVEGLVADANADAFTAQHRYRDAYRTFGTIGMVRRALHAAIRLVELTGDADLVAFVDESTVKLPPGSWIRLRSTAMTAWRADPLLAELTRAERTVLTLLHQGKSTAEIARIRGRAPQTIRNTVSALLKAFAVDNRQALVRESARRASRPDRSS